MAPRQGSTAVILLATAGALLIGASGSAQPATGPGRLARAALQGAPLSPADLDPGISDADRMRLAAWLNRRAGLPATVPGREVLALVERAGVAEDAAAAAAAVSSTADPLATVAAAERFLREHGGSPVAPWLYATIALHLRAALEAETGADARERLARRYRTMLQRVRGQDDGIWRLIADDLDAMASVSGVSAAHPRDFLPPG